MVPDAPYHYACDKKWWAKYYDEVKAGYPGESYTIDDIETPSNNPDADYSLHRVPSRQLPDFGSDIIHYGVSGGGNSGFQAANLAYIKGAKTILLLGFDMFGTHYFGPHPKGLDVASPFKRFIESFESITKDIEIINCSRQTALHCFPRMGIDDLL